MVLPFSVDVAINLEPDGSWMCIFSAVDSRHAGDGFMGRSQSASARQLKASVQYGGLEGSCNGVRVMNV